MSPQLLLRKPTVCEITGLKASSLDALIQKGKFPRPVHPTARTSAWVYDEVVAFVAQRIAERDALPA